MWRNDIKCKYMFTFRVKNLACKGLNLCVLSPFLGNIKDIFLIFYHLPTLRWHGYLKSIFVEDMHHSTLHIQNHECRWPGDAKKNESVRTSLIARYMGPIRGRQDPGGPHVCPMNFAGIVQFAVTRILIPYEDGILPIVEKRQSYDHLISTIRLPILVRWYCYIE